MKQEVLEQFEDDLFGIPVVLKHAAIKTTDETGATFITIPDESGLAAAIAMARAMLPVKLQAEDIRMMRKTLRMKSKDFAEAIGCSPARLSRIEKSTDGLGAYSELNIRQFVCARLSKTAPAIDYDPEMIATMQICGNGVPLMTFERVRLKKAESRAKTDTWDLAA